MATDKYTILLKGCGHHEEGIADAAITPGMAVEMAADGHYDPQTTAQAGSLKGGLKIATEDALQGKTITDAYAATDVLFMYIPVPGDIIHAFVKSAQNIAVGDKLVVEGGGSGLFVEAAGTETKFQLEALESSGGALGANTHIRCRVLAP